ncbi:MAG: heme biosynthesis HemY N-terminal domain-containing protein [Pseudomonadota bacterium]
MRWLILFLALLVMAALVAGIAAESPGYVLLSFQGWSLETSFTVFVIALLAGVLALYLAVGMLAAILRLPLRIARWRLKWQRDRAESSLNRGMVALHEGRWALAEKEFLKNIKPSHTPMLNYLGAARAAHIQGAIERRDALLQQAYTADQRAPLVVGLTQSEMLLEQGQFDRAASILAKLRQETPDHPRVLRLLVQAYEGLGSWEALEDLLQEVERRRVMTEPELERLTRDVYTNLLKVYDHKYDQATLQRLWDRMPKGVRQDEALIKTYAELLHAKGRENAAEALLREALQQEWRSGLAHLYGLITPTDPLAQLAHAERWVRQHPGDPQLLLSLGRICKRLELWGKARDYLKDGLPSGMCEIYREMAELMEKQKNHEAAKDYYRRALLASCGPSDTGTPLPALRQ